MNDTHRHKISELAMDADECGDNVLCLALMHVIKIAELPASVARRAINTQSLFLETLHEAARRTHV